MINEDHKKYSVEEFVAKFKLEPCVAELLKFIEKDNEMIKDLLINKYLQIPLSSKEEEDIREYFINNSVFSAATLANPATSVVTEFLYDPKASSPIDKYFFASKGGKAIHSRLIRVEENLHSLIEECLKNNKKVLVANLGGGLGRDIINVFAKYYKDNDSIKALNLDKDKNASKRGQRMAEAKGVLNKIDYVEGSFTRFKPKEKFDIILLVGVLCSLPPETCVWILNKIKPMLNKEGFIMASNATPQMLKEDPFTYMIMNIMGWSLIFKNEDELRAIFAKSGLKWQRSFTDDYGFHRMAIGTKNKSLFNHF